MHFSLNELFGRARCALGGYRAMAVPTLACGGAASVFQWLAALPVNILTTSAHALADAAQDKLPKNVTLRRATGSSCRRNITKGRA
jgi:hypothetical protein